MKKILLAFAGLFLLQVGFAQTTNPVEKKSSLIFSGGAALPIGPFASSTSMDGGMAKTGYNLNLQYSYRIKGIGLGIHGLYSSHGLKNEFAEAGLEMGNWTYYGITGGLVSSYPVNQEKKMFVDFKAMAGVGFANSPSMTYQGEGETIEEPSYSGTSFLGELGLGFRYMVSPSVFIYGGADWIFMKPEFTYLMENYEQKISAINLHVGVGFNF